MAGTQVLPPFPIFTDIDGSPLDDGLIHVGQAPEGAIPSLFWDRELTVPTTSPIQTIDGYPSNAGVRSRFYSSEPTYSITVVNKHGTVVYQSPSYSSSVEWSRSTLTSSINTSSEMLNAQLVNIWEFADQAIGYSPGGDPSAWDWAPAFNSAALLGTPVFVPAGGYFFSSTVTAKTAGGGFICAGIDAVNFSIDGTFSGDSVFELGDSSAPNTTHTLVFRGARFNLGGTTKQAVTCYGLRDGSVVEDIFIGNFGSTAFKTNKAGGGTGAATGLMNEGCTIQNIHAISSPTAVNGPIFQLDGLFETTVSECKALGYTLAANDAQGFSIGRDTESRGVLLDQSSAANMVNFGGSTNTNKGIVYGEWARDCWDSHITLENIDGVGVEYHGGNASGNLLPLNCRSRDIRPFFSATLGKINPLYKFRTCNSCQATGINHYSTVKANVQVTAENGINNYAELDINAEPSAVLGTIVVFDVGALTSNVVAGRASGVSLRKSFLFTPDEQHYQVLANQAYIQTDQFWTSFNAGLPGKMRFRDAALATLFEFDGTNSRNRAVKPFHAQGGQVITTQSVSGGGGAASYAPNMTNAEYHNVTFSNATSFAVNAPTSLVESARLMMRVTNGNGATDITPTFNAVFKGAPSALLPFGQVAYYEFVAVANNSLVYVTHRINVG